jgi:hypothetical protein
MRPAYKMRAKILVEGSWIRLEARRLPSLSTSRALVDVIIPPSLSYEQGGTADMQDQLSFEGVRNLMTRNTFTSMRVTVIKGPLLMPDSVACALCTLALRKGPLSAAFARLAAPKGVGRPTGVVGTLGMSAAGLITAAWVTLAF